MEKQVAYVYFNFDKNETEIMTPDGTIETISGVRFLNYLPLDKPLVCFCSKVDVVVKCYPGGKRLNDNDWQHFNKGKDCMEYKYGNTTFRSVVPFIAGKKVETLREIEPNTPETPITVCISNYLRQIKEDVSKLRFSLALNVTKQFFADIRDELWTETKLNSHYFFDFQSYKDARTGCKAGVLCADKRKRYGNLLMYDKKSAYAGALVHDTKMPVGKMRKISTEDKDHAARYIQKAVDEKKEIKVVFDSPEKPILPNQFYLWYDFRDEAYAFNTDDIVSVIRLGYYPQFIKFFYELPVRMYYWRDDVKATRTAKAVREKLFDAFEQKEALPKQSFERFIRKTELSMINGKAIQFKGNIQTFDDVKREFCGRGEHYITPEMAYHVIARVRYELIKAVCATDAVYFDTDGVKVPNNEKNIAYFENENEIIRQKNIDAGRDSDIGTWAFEGETTDFVLLSPKNYAYKTIDGEVVLKLGAMDYKTRDYLLNKVGNDRFLDILWEYGFPYFKPFYTIKDGNIISGYEKTPIMVGGPNNELRGDLFDAENEEDGD